MSVQPIDPTHAVTPVWRSSWGLVVVAVAVGLLSLWPFRDGLQQLWVWWQGSAEGGFGVLIPPVTAFLIWQQKDRLERMPFTGSWWGLALILLGGVLLLLGQFGTVFTLVQYAFVTTLLGIALSFLGWAAFRVIAVPLLILFFMIPLPEFVMANLSTKLQLVSSQLGVFLMRLLDISVYLEGNVIDLGTYKLEVAEACSGLRYLFPLMALGFLIGYFYKGAFWKRVVLFLSSIPITVIMNSLRIAIIGVTVEQWSIRMAEGFLHEFQGWMIFMISAAMILGEMMLLNRIGRENGTWRQLFGVELPAPTPRSVAVRNRPIPWSFIAASVLLVGLVASTFLFPRSVEIYPQRASFVDFPMQIGPWHGHRTAMDSVYSDTLKFDDYVLADYIDDSGSSINFYIPWYNSQRKGEAVHSPRSCLPGGGWQMHDFARRDLPGISIDGRPLHVNRTLIELGTQRELVYYWFQQRGRVIDNEFMVKWFLFADALFRHRTDGAMVRLVTAVPRTGSEAQADARLADLASKIAPILSRYVPD
ncbi:MAG: VPLPA-CTERM-specific exosortase XrtD [Steroidobacteraceae bacterium]